MKRRVGRSDAIKGTESGLVCLTLHLTPEEARDLARTFRRAADSGLCSAMSAQRYRVLHKAIQRGVKPSWNYTSRVIRPVEPDPTGLDMDLVVEGQGPFPVLAWSDVYAVWPALEAKNLSATEIARRLHVTPRSVVRWRKRERERREKT